MSRVGIGSMRPWPAAALTALALALATGCAADDNDGDDSGGQVGLTPPGDLASSSKERLTDVQVPEADTMALTEGNTSFALSLYQAIRGEHDNIFFSPHSISIALAMTYAGARGNTETEMAAAMNFTLSQDRLHPAFNALDLALLSRNQEGFALRIVNQLFARTGSTWTDAYLDLLAECYGAGLRELDFSASPEESRLAINRWVEEVTEERIKDLLKQGTITPATILVLTNAIYFNADWVAQFEKSATTSQPFHLLDGSEVSVPTMQQLESFAYYAGSGYQAVELPYAGERMAMLILVPDAGTFESFDAALDEAVVRDAVAGLGKQMVQLRLPKLEFEMDLDLNQTLQTLGMNDAFTAAADFTGMREQGQLSISDVVHKAFVRVDEEGTEAAAATAVVMSETSAQVAVVTLAVDRPFVFLIHDRDTGSVLFVGRVLQP